MKQHLKKTKVHIILSFIAELGKITFDSFLNEKYSHSAASRQLLKLLFKESQPSSRNLSKMLWRLTNEGLVERKGFRKTSTWILTEKGKKKLSRLKSKSTTLPKQDSIMRLVIFDIRESERSKRDTMRSLLVQNGYEQLQRSVWKGYIPLLPDIIEFIDSNNLGDCVHIFSVQGKGTLK